MPPTGRRPGPSNLRFDIFPRFSRQMLTQANYPGGASGHRLVWIPRLGTGGEWPQAGRAHARAQPGGATRTGKIPTRSRSMVCQGLTGAGGSRRGCAWRHAVISSRVNVPSLLVSIASKLSASRGADFASSRVIVPSLFASSLAWRP